jgi:hypothetical protein
MDRSVRPLSRYTSKQADEVYLYPTRLPLDTTQLAVMPPFLLRCPDQENERSALRPKPESAGVCPQVPGWKSLVSWILLDPSTS